LQWEWCLISRVHTIIATSFLNTQIIIRPSPAPYHLISRYVCAYYTVHVSQLFDQSACHAARRALRLGHARCLCPSIIRRYLLRITPAAEKYVGCYDSLEWSFAASQLRCAPAPSANAMLNCHPFTMSDSISILDGKPCWRFLATT
jgi:hypothetical protein